MYLTSTLDMSNGIFKQRDRLSFQILPILALWAIVSLNCGVTIFFGTKIEFCHK